MVNTCTCYKFICAVFKLSFLWETLKNFLGIIHMLIIFILLDFQELSEELKEQYRVATQRAK